jgi:hypothetical protein
MKSISVRVDAAKLLHTMAYGFGYNLHVIGDIRDEPFDVNILGSAFGGVPEGTDAESWDRIIAHADWLGFEFIRLIIDQRMYEPEAKGHYTWQSDAMNRLYRVLDWCQSRHVDVFLFEQWHGVAWNAVAGFDKWTSSPSDIEAYAVSFTTLVEKLVEERGYTCIRDTQVLGFGTPRDIDAMVAREISALGHFGGGYIAQVDLGDGERNGVLIEASLEYGNHLQERS